MLGVCMLCGSTSPSRKSNFKTRTCHDDRQAIAGPLAVDIWAQVGVDLLLSMVADRARVHHHHLLIERKPRERESAFCKRNKAMRVCVTY